MEILGTHKAINHEEGEKKYGGKDATKEFPHTSHWLLKGGSPRREGSWDPGRISWHSCVYKLTEREGSKKT